ncbi:uncharacterized protein [Typha latifolia]|uniref:uncharacterized protein n=1 Tax=Typha latifolia TaxID=4733 RepID=UPI003C2CE1D2
MFPYFFSTRLQTLLLLTSFSLLLFLLLLLLRSSPTSFTVSSAASSSPSPSPTSLRHLLFGIASSSKSWPRRKELLRLWWRPGLARGIVFLDSPLDPAASGGVDHTLPPTSVSADTSRFPYSYKGGRRSAVRVARIVKELVEIAGDSEVRWIVLGDDDTVFVLENLVGTLAKYDWEGWRYIGGRSEIVEQNVKHSFGMAFGGAGIAISYPLARVLANVLDSCLVRYPHLYGSDARIFACLAELGVELTHEPGFHQIDLRGDISGLLSAHPLASLVSLHHLDFVNSLYPDMNQTMALKHFFEAVNADPGRILQQTVCYDRLKSRTISISWGYVVQLFEGNLVLTDLLSVPKTFTQWKRSRNTSSDVYMFNSKEYSRDQCKRPAIFLLKSVSAGKDKIESNYSRHFWRKCSLIPNSTRSPLLIRVSSQRLNDTVGKASRRHCCDVLPSSSGFIMKIDIRKCKDNELIAMQP